MNRDAAIGHFGLAMNEIMAPFDMYGLGILIPEAIEEIKKQALLLHERLTKIEKGENNVAKTG